MEWNDEAIARLRALWAEGHSTAEIGRRMNVSKNAVVGKAHRLNLTARPSPIRRDPNGSAARPVVPRRLVGPTLPSLPTEVRAVMVSPMVIEPAPAMAPPRAAAPLPSPVARPAVVSAAAERPMPVRAVAARSMRTAPCCWPIGEPGTRSFRFCDADASGGKPYCTEHAQLAYVKVRDRRDEAAA